MKKFSDNCIPMVYFTGRLDLLKTFLSFIFSRGVIKGHLFMFHVFLIPLRLNKYTTLFSIFFLCFLSCVLKRPLNLKESQMINIYSIKPNTSWLRDWISWFLLSKKDNYIDQVLLFHFGPFILSDKFFFEFFKFFILKTNPFKTYFQNMNLLATPTHLAWRNNTDTPLTAGVKNLSYHIREDGVAK